MIFEYYQIIREIVDLLQSDHSTEMFIKKTLICTDISAEFDDETEDSTLPPSFMNLKMNPSNGAYVSTSFLPAEVDDGFVIGTTLAILSALLIILIAVSWNSILPIVFFRLESI